MRGSTLTSGSATPLPASPAPTPPHDRNTDFAAWGISLHPDFGKEGDMVVLVTEDGVKTGFLVDSSALSTMSATFASALSRVPASQHLPMIAVSEGVREIELLLYALVFGWIGTPRSPRPPPTVDAYLALLRLYEKYEVRSYLRAVLVHRIEERAFDLVSPLSHARGAGAGSTGAGGGAGSGAAQALAVCHYLRLAHICRSNRIWETALRYATTWGPYTNPWRINGDQRQALGEAYDVLLALEAVKNSSGDNSIGALRVTYTSGSGKLDTRVSNRVWTKGETGRRPGKVWFLQDTT